MINLTSNSILYKSFNFCNKFISDEFSRYSPDFMPKDLCTFARSYFYRLVVFSFIVYVIVAALIGIPFAFLNEPVSFIILMPAIMVLLFSVIAAVIGTAMGIFFLYEKVFKKFKPESSFFEKFKESIPVQYVNSKLHGYCVPISYNDEIVDV